MTKGFDSTATPRSFLFVPSTNDYGATGTSSIHYADEEENVPTCCTTAKCIKSMLCCLCGLFSKPADSSQVLGAAPKNMT